MMATTEVQSERDHGTDAFPHQAFIDGAFRDAASGKTFACDSPVDGQTLCQVAACDAEDADRAVASARRAFEQGTWSEAAPEERKTTLLKLAELLELHSEELARMMTLDMGKPISEASGEVEWSAGCLRYFAEAVDKVYGEIAPTDGSQLALVAREPLGVVAAVVPWNYPLMMPIWKLAPALATGCSVVLKPAEQSPLVAMRLGAIAAEAGLPDGVLNVLPGLGETAGQALGRHMDVDKVAFTGSPEVGRMFLRYAGESNMKGVQLECGGKSPIVVLADAPNLELLAEQAAAGIFGNAGQVCNASSRLIVHESLSEELLERLRAQAADWQPGDPLDAATQMGALVSETQMRRVLGFIEDGLNEGAKLSVGGRRVREESGGFYVEPTIFAEAKNEMSIAQDEIFGPVLTTVSFADDEDGIRLANDTRYGLAAAVFTSDIAKAHRAAKALRAGSVYINCYDYGDDTVPFGGFKDSGAGRDKSLHALDNYTALKTTIVNLAD
jgi:acyl-CoA reductase-like NAD-dependent aldehyde dehydrogenase